MGGSRSLYAPYRALGLVCDGAAAGACAPYLHRLGTASFITCPVDGARALHLYDINLQLKGVSPPVGPEWSQTPGGDVCISAIAARFDYTFVAIGANVGVYRRMRPFALWRAHEEPITSMIICGNLLVTVSGAESRVVAWTLPSSSKAVPALEGLVSADVVLPPRFFATTVIHPPTYLNKILLGGKDGRCLLVNLRSKSIVHEFEGFGVPISVLEPSPVLDVVAVGTEDGHIIMHNFRVDETIVKFRHEAVDDDLTDARSYDQDNSRIPQSVRAISFRSDGDESMLSGDAMGNLILWDLNEKRVRSIARRVHLGGSAIAQFLAGESLLVTAGTSDNMLKVHAFDGVDHEARVLRSREGHRLPPTRVRFCGQDSKMMVSAGLDREVRLVSAVRDARNRSFAQADLSKSGARSKKRRRTAAGIEKGAQQADLLTRLPPVVAISTNNARRRDKDFANVVTVHAGRDEAYTWRLESGAVHEHVLKPPSHGPTSLALAFKRGTKKTPSKKNAAAAQEKPERRSATCVIMSPCGNFAIVGSVDGRVHSYNLQSGRHLGAFEDPSIAQPPSDADNASGAAMPAPWWSRAHIGTLAGLAVDACGDVSVTAGATDRRVKFWNMHTRALEAETITTEANATMICWCRVSELLAVACDDFGIYVYDASTRKLARRFHGHSAPISDLCFDSDGRRVVSASMDGTLRTWDLPSGTVIDVMRCTDAPTSVSVAPGGEYIATTHVNNLGIALWTDRSKFGAVPANGRTRSLSRRAIDNEEEVLVPGSYAVEESEDGASTADEEEETDTGTENEGKTEDGPRPLSLSLATLSGKPSTHWTTLSNLDAIKKRNKPIEAPKKPASAPFFLPTVKGLQLAFDVGGKDKTGDDEAGDADSRIRTSGKKNSKAMEEDEDANEDMDAWDNSDFGRLVAREQYDSAAKLLRSLGASGVDLELRTLSGSRSRRNAAIYFQERLRSPKDFELTQAHLGVFLSAQGVDLARDEGGSDLLKDLGDAQSDAWSEVRGRFEAVSTLTAFFSGQV